MICLHFNPPQRGGPMNSRGFQPPVGQRHAFNPGGVVQCGQRAVDTETACDSRWGNPSGVESFLWAVRGLKPPAIHGEPRCGSCISALVRTIGTA